MLIICEVARGESARESVGSMSETSESRGMDFGCKMMQMLMYFKVEILLTAAWGGTKKP